MSSSAPTNQFVGTGETITHLCNAFVGVGIVPSPKIHFYPLLKILFVVV